MPKKGRKKRKRMKPIRMIGLKTDCHGCSARSSYQCDPESGLYCDRLSEELWQQIKPKCQKIPIFRQEVLKID
jgi:hypothetical protein